MIELTTQCPKCQHRFDVTLEQLQQRKGLLRCTQCAHIFDAYECAVPKSSTPTQVDDSVHTDIRVFLDATAPSVTPSPLPPSPPPPLSPPPPPPYYAAQQSSNGRWFWGGLLVLLMGLLLAQLLYVYRAQVANSVPMMRPVLQWLCQGVGCSVPYMREIDAIDINQSRLQQENHQTDPQSNQERYQYSLQLQLKNNLAWAQEWPTLVVSFSDAAAASMATIALGPEQYLPTPLQRAPFAAGAQQSITLPVSIADKKINGFSIEKYYP